MQARGATTRVELFAHHGAQGVDFLAGNPYVDEVCHTHGLPFNPYKIAAKRAGDYRLLTVADKLVWERPEIYLTAEEQHVANDILSGGPYVAFHPFAGDSDEEKRRFQIDPNAILKALDVAGIRVVVLGGPGESVSFSGPNVINMIGKYSVRLHVYLVAHSQKFIGSMSCYNCAALEYEIPSLIFAPPHHPRDADTRRLVNEYTFDIFAMMKKTATVMYWDDLPQEIGQAVVQWLNVFPVQGTGWS